jgi:hypothetical protein
MTVMMHLFESAERANKKHRLAESKKRDALPLTGDKSSFEVNWRCEWDEHHLREKAPPVRACLQRVRSEMPNEGHAPPKARKRDVVTLDAQGNSILKITGVKGEKQRMKREECETCDGGRDCKCGATDKCPQIDLLKCPRCGDTTINGCSKKGCKAQRDKEEVSSVVVSTVEDQGEVVEMEASSPVLHLVSTIGLPDNASPAPAPAPAVDQAVHAASSPPCTPQHR